MKRCSLKQLGFFFIPFGVHGPIVSPYSKNHENNESERSDNQGNVNSISLVNQTVQPA